MTVVVHVYKSVRLFQPIIHVYLKADCKQHNILSAHYRHLALSIMYKVMIDIITIIISCVGGSKEFTVLYVIQN